MSLARRGRNGTSLLVPDERYAAPEIVHNMRVSVRVYSHVPQHFASLVDDDV